MPHPPNRRTMAPARMDGTSFFPYASSFTINGGTFIAARRPHALQTSSQRVVRLTGPASLPIIKDHDILPVKQVVCGQGYRIHVAHLDGFAVIVKVFNGRVNSKDWEASAALSRNLMCGSLFS
ncbi:hypothetical protein C8R44DRAFT_342176 [Mycena epipterygia]|nr:hypothetical protein C8R44DRAFT_342176 [Mycena epipterygia]